MATPKPTSDAKASENKDNQAAAPVPAPKMEVVKPQPVSDQLPLDERLHKLNMLYSLHSKYNKLQESKLKLSEFETEKGDTPLTLNIFDNNSRHTVNFQTSNVEVIKEVIECVKKSIDNRLLALAPQIDWKQ